MSREKQCTGPCGRTLPATPEFFHRCKKEKDGLKYRCKQCTCEESKAYQSRLGVREHRRSSMKSWRERPEVREHVQAYSKAYANQPENRKRSNQQRRARRNHPEVKERRRIESQSYYSHPGVRSRILAYQKSYYRTPDGRDRMFANTYAHRARKRTVQGTHTPAQIREQLKRQNYHCYYAACGYAKFKQRKDGRYIYHIDHTFPLTRVEGTDIPANDISYLVLACPHCNTSKHNKFPHEWPEGGRLL